MCGYRDRARGSQRAPIDPRLFGLRLDAGTFVAIVGKGESNSEAREVIAGSERAPSLHRVSVETGAITGALLPDLRLSDHAPFWDRKLPALMWTDTAFFRNPHYHRETDIPETLDYDFMSAITDLLCHHIVRTTTSTKEAA